jgi:hypothetical protein
VFLEITVSEGPGEIGEAFVVLLNVRTNVRGVVCSLKSFGTDFKRGEEAVVTVEHRLLRGVGGHEGRVVKDGGMFH